MGIIADDFGIKLIFADRNFLQEDITFIVRQGKMGDSGITGGDKVYGSP
jgi:hypothetical protein